MGRKRSDGWPEGVHPRRSSIRIDFIYLGQRRRETLKIPPTPANKKFAERKRSQIILEIEKDTFDYGVHFPGSALMKRVRATSTTSVAVAATAWLKSRVQRPYTREVNQGYIKRHIEGEPIGRRPLGLVVPSELQGWRAALAGKLSPKTVNNVISIVRGAFQLAFEDGSIKKNPAAFLVNLKKIRGSHADPFLPQELTKLGGAMTNQQDRNLVEVWWNGGMREGEMFAVQWPDVDWKKQGIWVSRNIVNGVEQPTKDSETRFVYLGPRGMAVLTRQRAHTQLAGKHIFINTATGTNWTSGDHFRRRMVRWCKRAEIRYRPPMQLRHTYASLALSAGEAPLFVMQQLGHATLQMLQEHYAKWMPGVRRDLENGFSAVAAAI